MAVEQLSVALIIPAFNEKGKIGRVITKIPKKCVNVVVVIDDCSDDGTAIEAERAGATVIRHKTNQGVGAAIRTGIDYALTNNYDIVAVLSGDDQHDPLDLPGLLQPIMKEGYDFVQGSRRMKGLQATNIGWLRRWLTWMYTLLFRSVTGFPCTDATNGGRAFRTNIFKDKKINLWQDWLNTYELEPYLLYQTVRRGLKVKEAPMRVIYHSQGTTKMKPVRDWWRILRPLIYLPLGVRK